MDNKLLASKCLKGDQKACKELYDSYAPSMMAVCRRYCKSQLLLKMPIGYRTVFNLHVIEGYGYDEIATMLQITESTCRSQMHKAKNCLAKKITELQPEVKYAVWQTIGWIL